MQQITNGFFLQFDQDGNCLAYEEPADPGGQLSLLRTRQQVYLVLRNLDGTFICP